MAEFHFCQEFKKSIKGKNFEKDVYNKIYDYEQLIHLKDLKDTRSVACFRGSIYGIKTSKPRTRTLIQEKNVRINSTDLTVFFVRDIIADEYLYVKIFSQLKNGEWLKNNPLPEEDLESFKRAYKNKTLTKKTKKSFPPDKLTSWLKDYELKLNNDIYETETWVKYALSNSHTKGMMDRYVNTFRIILEKIIKEEPGEAEVIKEKNGIQIKKYIDHNVGILYSIIQKNAKSLYLLHNAAHVEDQKGYWDEAIKSLFIDFENDFEDIRRKAFRSYPKWTIGEDNLWFAIQKSKEMSNLSLTRDQIDFFRTFKSPYYINGQAGSGKSTMLYYLFANAYYYKCHDEIDGNLIFLTENKGLLKQAKNSVFDLLSNNPEFDGLDAEQKEKNKNDFHTLKELLISLLPESAKSLFKENKYLDFSKFKQLYENSNLPKSIIDNCSAEESWFTIITYIYGYATDKKIISQNYLTTVDKKSQIIPIDKFKHIEKDVLPFYERLINENQYWDRLKIIRYINEKIEVKKKYIFLICDEAQDFCRVELRFILRLSEYIKHDLSKIDQVPVVFAGDPNQTVNPTGFRQDEITSMLYEELKEIAGFSNKNKVADIYNPSLNYRSTQPVVSLANFVQHYRMKNLGIKKVDPQKTKLFSSNTEENSFFNYQEIEDPKLKQDLIKKLQYKIFIIPVNAQEKKDYIDKYAILSSIDKVEVKTSIEAKGAEYSQVILFGFGEYFLEKFKTLAQNKQDTPELFKRSFFFNKLYVGLTRAQTELIIIDSQKSEEYFWKKIVDQTKNYESSEWKILDNFKKETILYNPGTINHIIQSTKEDALKNAQEDKKQGLYDKNPARLQVAANQFFKIEKKQEGYECLALSEELKENWKSAADHYLKLDYPKYEEAANCLFRGQFFKELISKIGNNLRTPEHDIRISISRLIGGEKIMKQDIDILKKNKKELNEILENLEWRNELIDQFIISSKTIELKEQKTDFVEVMEFIAHSTDRDLWKIIGNIRFDLKNYQKAIDAWSEINSFGEKYCISQVEWAREKKDNQKIILWLDELLRFKEASEQINIYNEIIEIHKKNILDNDHFGYFSAVFKAFILQKPKDNEVIKIGKKIEKTSQPNELIEFYEKLLGENDLNNQIATFILERWAKTKWKAENEKPNLKKLNDAYLQFSKKNDIIFKKFDLYELKNISECPQEIKWNPNKYFRKIKICNFRRFKEITLSNVGQFNLIVGDNNTGKTSLLEALLFKTNKKEHFQNLVFAHISRKNIRKIQNDTEEKYAPPTNFISNNFIKKDAKELIFELKEHRNYWNYKIGESERPEIQNTIIKKISSKNITEIPLVPFGIGFDKDLASAYFEKIEKIKAERNEFIKLMNLFIPNVEKIAADTQKGEIYIEEKDSEVASPLHQYGAGANKLFRILVQLTFQKNNKLLIDEIDAGIHYSRFSRFWEIILEVADKYKIQIFATTHNLECVNYFSDVLKNEKYKSYQNDSRIITLEELPDKDKTVKAYTHTYNEFKYELDNGFEIRGGDL